MGITRHRRRSPIIRQDMADMASRQAVFRLWCRISPIHDGNVRDGIGTFAYPGFPVDLLLVLVSVAASSG